MSDSIPTLAPDAVITGHSAIERLPGLVAATGAKRALLVCGRTSFEASGAARILPALEGQVALRRWDEHRPNPTVEHITAGLAVAAEHRPDLIIGVGGGSTLDTAKLIAALSAVEDGSDVGRVARRLESREASGDRDVYLILVPTTSGSGAQATHFATVYIEDSKHSVAGVALLPDKVVLDPALAMSSSFYQRAVSGFDALAQSIESMWAVGGDARSRDDAEAAIRLIFPSLVDFSRKPAAATAESMGLGSQFAGQAINRSRTTIPHALSYALTQQIGLPHGHAVAHTFPAVFSRHLVAGPAHLHGVSRFEHRKNMDRLIRALGVDDGASALACIEAIVQDVGLREPQKSRHSAIIESSEALAQTVDPTRAQNNPVRFGLSDLADILVEGTECAQKKIR